MQKPKSRVYALGNVASMAVIMGGSAYVTWQWWTVEGWSNWTPALAWFAAASSANARKKLTAYARWKRDWDQLGGETPARFSWQWRKPLAVAVVWSAMLWGLVTAMDYRNPLNVCAAWMFGFGTLGLMVQAVRRRSAGQRKPGKAVFVTVVAKLRGPSPSAIDAARHLPAYCKAILAPDMARRA